MASDSAVATVQAQAPAVRAPLQFEAVDFDQLYRMAQVLSSSSLLPDALRGKPGDVAIVLMQGKELGLQPMQSLRGIHVIKGRATLAADLLGALVQRSPICEYLTLLASDENSATYEAKRKGSPKPIQMTYTFKDAEKAGLTAKDNWRNYRPQMIRARGLSAICRAVFPDLVYGVYVHGEIPADPLDPIDLEPQQGATNGTVIDQAPRKATTIEDLVAQETKNPVPPAATANTSAPVTSSASSPPAESSEPNAGPPASSASAGAAALFEPTKQTGPQKLAVLIGEARAIQQRNPDAFDAVCKEHGADPVNLKSNGLDTMEALIVDLRTIRSVT